MVIIVTEKSDISTFKVVKYLKSMATPYTIISAGHHLLEIKDQFIANPEKCVVWMRRMNYRFGQQTAAIFDKEVNKVNRYYLYLLENTAFHCYGTILGEYEHNKLIDLHLAKKVGLRTPANAIVNNKKALENFAKSHQHIITKPISNVVQHKISPTEFELFGMTSFVNPADAMSHFTDSLIQEFIPNKIEVRVFYFDQEFFSTAMIKTDHFIPDIKDTKLENNRTLNICLPKKIKTQLSDFVELLQINTCSFDFLLDDKGEFIFLEVNRCGQFDWVSSKGNYEIEKRIATKLTEKYSAAVLS